jgi:hypothetical protein
MENHTTFTQGFQATAQEECFPKALRAAIDYRGDVTLHLTDGKTVEGYIFNFMECRLGLYPADGGKKLVIPIEQVASIHFSGASKLSRNSWEKYQAKKKRMKEGVYGN